MLGFYGLDDAVVIRYRGGSNPLLSTKHLLKSRSAEWSGIFRGPQLCWSVAKR